MPGPDGRQKRLRQGGFLPRAAAEQGLAEVLELAGPDAMDMLMDLLTDESETGVAP